MSKFRIFYTISLVGIYEIDAASEEEALEAFDDLARADLVAEAEYTNADVQVDDVEIDASPLEQLAEQAE